MPLTSEDRLFARIVIHNKLASESVVNQCLNEAEREGVPLAEVMRRKAVLTEKQIQAVEGLIRRKNAAAGNESRTAAAKPGADLGEAERTYTVEDVRRMDFSRFAREPIDSLLQEARRLGASDLHCHVGAPPFMRIHGSHVFLNHPPYEAKELERKIFELMGDYEKRVFNERLDVDFCLQRDHGRYRTSVYRQRLGIDAVFRIIPRKIPTLAELHLPQYLDRFTKYTQGIVLITGPAGCGKSATMAALLEIINQERQDHVVTIEDPIEYVFQSKNCNVNQRQVKVHTENFATALRSALRADPDVIAIGEMRDLETISVAITAAETGHLVLATLHTTTAVRSIDRIIDVFPPKEQEQVRAMVAESMRGVISQQLIPRKDGLGREPALEIMFATPAVANLIRDRKTFQLPSVLQTGARLGMKIMDDSIQELLDKGLITREAAQYYATVPERFGRKKGERPPVVG